MTALCMMVSPQVVLRGELGGGGAVLDSVGSLGADYGDIHVGVASIQITVVTLCCFPPPGHPRCQKSPKLRTLAPNQGTVVVFR